MKSGISPPWVTMEFPGGVSILVIAIAMLLGYLPGSILSMPIDAPTRLTRMTLTFRKSLSVPWYPFKLVS